MLQFWTNFYYCGHFAALLMVLLPFGGKSDSKPKPKDAKPQAPVEGEKPKDE